MDNGDEEARKDGTLAVDELCLRRFESRRGSLLPLA